MIMKQLLKRTAFGIRVQQFRFLVYMTFCLAPLTQKLGGKSWEVDRVFFWFFSSGSSFRTKANRENVITEADFVATATFRTQRIRNVHIYGRGLVSVVSFQLISTYNIIMMNDDYHFSHWHRISVFRYNNCTISYREIQNVTIWSWKLYADFVLHKAKMLQSAKTLK